MKNFVKVNGIWREYNPETNEIVGESGYFDISNFETMQAESVHDLDWNGTVVLNKKLRTGWLNPEGEFFGCEPWCHKLQAQIIHRSDERKLEEGGWVRITKNEKQVMVAGFCSLDETLYPSSAQLSFLYKNYQDNKHLYYEIWNIATARKERIKEEWGLGE